jgi:2-polyprenyl-3-methyl-5-hydroxy-6-metoxy-1,4-benzoquinol methylase
MPRSSQVDAYEKNATAYDAINDGRQRTMRKKARAVATALSQDFAGTILEVGCGTGLFTEHIAQLLPNAIITATDAFPAMLDLARPRLDRYRNVRLQQYDAEENLGSAEGFDAVIGCDIIHHIDEPVKAMMAWRLAVRSGGHMVFIETNGINPILFLRAYGKAEESRQILSTHYNLSRWPVEAGWQEVAVTHVPIHLPNGPHVAWPTLDRIEELMHKAPPIRRIAGALLLCATAGA